MAHTEQQKTVELIAAIERAINVGRTHTDDDRDEKRPLVKATRQLTDVRNWLADTLCKPKPGSPPRIDCGTV